MTITLGGGGEGPRTGSTAMGGRPVQVQTPPAEVKRPEPVRPPAAKTPEMTLPTKAAAQPTRGTTPPVTVTQAPDQARGRTPTRGAETSAGSAVAATGARGQGFGLSSGGGPGTGSRLDVANFCCPDYLITMTERIRANWNQKQDTAGETVVRFTIQRDGTLTNIVLEQSSGSPILDIAAQRALAVTRQIPALPAQYPDSTLGVHLTFVYQQ
jgi:TonB family protein